MLRVITKSGTFDYVKVSLLGFYLSNGYVVALA